MTLRFAGLAEGLPDLELVCDRTWVHRRYAGVCPWAAGVEDVCRELPRAPSTRRHAPHHWPD